MSMTVTDYESDAILVGSGQHIQGSLRFEGAGSVAKGTLLARGADGLLRAFDPSATRTTPIYEGIVASAQTLLLSAGAVHPAGTLLARNEAGGWVLYDPTAVDDAPVVRGEVEEGVTLTLAAPADLAPGLLLAHDGSTYVPYDPSDDTGLEVVAGVLASAVEVADGGTPTVNVLQTGEVLEASVTVLGVTPVTITHLQAARSAGIAPVDAFQREATRTVAGVLLTATTVAGGTSQSVDILAGGQVVQGSLAVAGGVVGIGELDALRQVGILPLAALPDLDLRKPVGVLSHTATATGAGSVAVDVIVGGPVLSARISVASGASLSAAVLDLVRAHTLIHPVKSTETYAHDTHD